MKKFKILAILALMLGSFAHSQVRTYGNTVNYLVGQNAFIDASGFYSDDHKGKGLAFPRTDLTKFEFITTLLDGIDFYGAFDGMVVYNTGTGKTVAGNGAVVDVIPGFYYFHNPTGYDKVSTGQWEPLGDAATTQLIGIDTGTGPPSTTAPVNPPNPEAGDIYVDESNGDIYTFNGTTWVRNNGALVDADGDTGITLDKTADDDIIRFDTRNVERMVIDSLGNVGIGVANPTKLLDVDAGNISGTTTAGMRLKADATTNMANAGYEIEMGSSSGDVNGYFRGTRTALTAFLGMEVGSVSRDGLRFVTGDATATTEKMRILQNGNVGIGMDNPTEKLVVEGNAQVTGALKDSSGDAGNNGQILTSTSGGTNWIDMPSGADNLGDHTATQHLNMGTAFSIQVNGGTGSAGQVLTRSATGMTWTSPSSTTTVQTLTTTASIGDGMGLVLLNPSADMTVTMPEANSATYPAGTILHIRRMGAHTGTADSITLSSGSGTPVSRQIEGENTRLMNIGYQSNSFVATTTGWMVMK